MSTEMAFRLYERSSLEASSVPNIPVGPGFLDDLLGPGWLDNLLGSAANVYPRRNTGNDYLAIKSAIAEANETTAGGVVQLGNYTWTIPQGAPTTAFEYNPSRVSLNGDGAVLDFRTATSVSNAFLIRTTDHQGRNPMRYMHGFKILGHNNLTHLTLDSADATDGYNSTIEFHRLDLVGGKVGLLFGKNTYITKMDRCRFHNFTDVCVRRTNAANAGENLLFVGCTLADSLRLIHGDGPNCDMYFFGCSFDYPTQDYMFLNNSQVELHGCHIEGHAPAAGTSPFQFDNHGALSMFGGNMGFTGPNAANYLFKMWGSGDSSGGMVVIRDTKMGNVHGAIGLCSDPTRLFVTANGSPISYRLAMASANIATLAYKGSHFTGVLSQNTTLSNPIGLSQGQRITWKFEQPASGGPFTLGFDSKFVWAGGTPPTIPTTAGAIFLVEATYDGAKDKLYSRLTSY